MRLHGIFAGRIDDRGFIESGYLGLQNAGKRCSLDVQIVQNVDIEVDDVVGATAAAPIESGDLVVLHGGKSNLAAPVLATRFPRIRFLSTHGNTSGENYSCWGVRQYQPAFLAGALAGLWTRSGIVGHLSGIRVPPGLRSRAAYVHGVRATNPRARVVTCFCGTQDDNQISYRAAIQELDEGADILFTMLNSGRQGAIEACRERRVPQIGNVRDWTTSDPDVFVASAIADVGSVVGEWVDAIMRDRSVAGSVKEFGLEHGAIARLHMSDAVPSDRQARIGAIAAGVLEGKVKIPTDYDGEEMIAPRRAAR